MNSGSVTSSDMPAQSLEPIHTSHGQNVTPPGSPGPSPERRLSSDPVQVRTQNVVGQAGDTSIYSTTPTQAISQPASDHDLPAMGALSLMPALSQKNRLLGQELEHYSARFEANPGHRIVSGLGFLAAATRGLMDEFDAVFLAAKPEPLRRAKRGNDRGLNDQARKKEEQASRAEKTSEAVVRALEDRDTPFGSWRTRLLPAMGSMMDGVATELYSRNESEAAEHLLGQWQQVMPMLAGTTYEEIRGGFRQCSEFIEQLNRQMTQAGVPRRLDPPAHLTCVGEGNPDDLGERYQNNLDWIRQAYDTIQADAASPDSFVNAVAPVRRSCLNSVSSILKVMVDTVACASRLWPDLKFDAAGNVDQLRSSLKKIRGEQVCTDKQTSVSSEAQVRRILAEFESAANAMVGFFADITTLSHNQARAELPTTRQDEKTAQAELDAGADPDFQVLDTFDSDASATDEEKEFREPEPHAASSVRERRSVGRQVPVPALDPALAGHGGSPLPPPATTPDFRMVALSETASLLDALQASGRWATTRDISEIADRIGSGAMGRLEKTDLQRLLRSLGPHLARCTRSGCGLTFQRLLPLLQASNLCGSRPLCAAFGKRVADNFSVKPDTDDEQQAFNRFLMDGGALELLQQMRGLPRECADPMLARLLALFNGARATISPDAFSRALEARMQGRETSQGKRQVSLSRALSGLMPFVAYSSSARMLGSVISSMHGFRLPGEVMSSVLADDWLREAVRVFKGDSAHPPYVDSKDGISFNPHDAGIAVAREVLSEHLSRRPDRMGVPENRSLRVTVGGHGHSGQSVKTLRRLVLDMLQSHPGWVAVEADRATIVIARPDRIPLGLPLLR